jgi:hypothetical protein
LDKTPVLTIWLSHKYIGESDAYAEFRLPATDYELQEALKRADLREGDEAYCEILEYTRFPYLEYFLEGTEDLYGLNALAKKLGALEDWQADAFEGLVLMEEAKGESVGIPRLYDLAASTEACQVLYAVKNDEELGHFYVDNDFVPEMEDIPEALYKFLDYAKIGKEYREGEGGVFLRRGSGYVTQTGDLKEEFKYLDLTPKEPDYAVLLEVAVPDTEVSVMLKLPCEPAELESVLSQIGAENWEDLCWRCADCRAPSLADAFTTADSIFLINDTAELLESLPDEALEKLKGLSNALGITRLEDVTRLIGRLEDYRLVETYSNPVELARHILDGPLQPGEVGVLLSHLDCRGFTEDILKRDGMALTPNGLLERKDGEPLVPKQTQDTQNQGRMEMR